jgi:hypothetical protein
VWVAAVAPTAAASPPPPSSIVVYAPLCPSSPVSFVSFVDSLRVELAGVGAKCCEIGVNEPVAVLADDAVRVALSVDPCAATTLDMTIDVALGDHGSALRNVLSFADIAAPARPRALSLAVAELVRALGREPTVAQAPAPLTATTLAVVAPPPSSPAAPPRWAVAGEAELRFYPAPGTALWGGRLSVGLTRRRLHGTLDVGGLFHR